MLKSKTYLCGVVAIAAVVELGVCTPPAQAQLGQSDWINPSADGGAGGGGARGSGGSPGGFFARRKKPAVSSISGSEWIRPQTSDLDNGAPVMLNVGGAGSEMLNGQVSESQYAPPVAQEQASQCQPMQPMQPVPLVQQPTSVFNPPAGMLPRQADDSMASVVLGLPGGSTAGQAAGDGLGQALGTAAAVGMLGSQLGGILQGMGFDSHFHTYGATPNGTFYADRHYPSGYGASAGGIGGMGRSLTRNVERGIDYAATTGTSRLMQRMMRGR